MRALAPREKRPLCRSASGVILVQWRGAGAALEEFGGIVDPLVDGFMLVLPDGLDILFCPAAALPAPLLIPLVEDEPVAPVLAPFPALAPAAPPPAPPAPPPPAP
jgi:hypothetical protein